MLRNWKTSGIGIVVIAGSILYLASRTWTGMLSLEDLKALLTLLAGTGLLAAQDGAP